MWAGGVYSRVDAYMTTFRLLNRSLNINRANVMDK